MKYPPSNSAELSNSKVDENKSLLRYVLSKQKKAKSSCTFYWNYIEYTKSVKLLAAQILITTA